MGGKNHVQSGLQSLHSAVSLKFSVLCHLWILYDVELSTEPLDMGGTIRVNISSSSPSCVPSSRNLLFTALNWNIPQAVTLAIGGDNIDQAEGSDGSDLFSSCAIVHTVISTDRHYRDTEAYTINVDVNDDDVAAMRLRPTFQSSVGQGNSTSFEPYKVSFLGPLTIAEGKDDYFGVELLTRPTAEVTVRITVSKPREETPVEFLAHPDLLTFSPDMWNGTTENPLPQLVKISVMDDQVDSAFDVEDFTLNVWVSRSESEGDSSYGNQGVSNSTVVVRVQDDDTAGILLSSEAASSTILTGARTLKLDEGGNDPCESSDPLNCLDRNTILGLTTKPTADVTLWVYATSVSEGTEHVTDMLRIELLPRSTCAVDDEDCIVAMAASFASECKGNFARDSSPGYCSCYFGEESACSNDFIATTGSHSDILIGSDTHPEFNTPVKTILVPPEAWSQIRVDLKVTALTGEYNGIDTFKLVVSPSQTSTDYNQRYGIEYPSTRVATQQATVSFAIVPARVGLIGVPVEDVKYLEGEIYEYEIAMGSPLQETKVEVAISIKEISGGSSSSRCNFVGGDSTSLYTFHASNWNVKEKILIATADDNEFYAKDALSYTCIITHVVTSSEDTSTAKQFEDMNLTLNVVSSGCGKGEWRMEFNRGPNNRNCVCGPSFFLPKDSDCQKCDAVTSICELPGLLAPVVREGYWREEPTSRDIVKHKFYGCPFGKKACAGGNTTKDRCAPGYDDDGPLCATCSKGYVLMAGACVLCDSMSSDGSSSDAVYGLLALGVLVMLCGSTYYHMRPALTNTRENEIRQLFLGMGGRRFKEMFNIMLTEQTCIEETKITKVGRVQLPVFKKVLSKLRVGLISEQLKQLFDRIDYSYKGTIEYSDFQGWVLKLKKCHDCHNWLDSAKQLVVHMETQCEKRFDSSVKIRRASASGKLELSALKLQIKQEERASAQKAVERVQGFRNDSQSAGNCGNEISEIVSHGETNSYKSRQASVGGIFMKVKLLVGFGQVLSYFPVTFDTVPWPKMTINLMKYLEFFSMPWSVFSIFGLEVCHIQQGFLPKFRQHMALVPGVLAILVLAWYIAYSTASDNSASCFKKKNEARLRSRGDMNRKNRCSMSKHTRSSSTTAFYTLVSLCLYTIYVGVATRIFRLFKCIKVGSIGNETWYLTADYEVICFEGEWVDASFIAYCGMVIFVLGIPLGQFCVLYKNRRYIDGRHCRSSKEVEIHQQVVTKYGSIFQGYRPESYYFDLIDLLRRLVLTGGLILVGGDENAVAQIFLGILVSAAWLCLVLHQKPYISKWDTMLSATLSFSVLVTLVTGVCLRLFDLTSSEVDEYEQEAFGAVLVLSIVLCILLSLATIILSTEKLQGKVMECCSRFESADTIENKLFNLKDDARQVHAKLLQKLQKKLENIGNADSGKRIELEQRIQAVQRSIENANSRQDSKPPNKTKVLPTGSNWSKTLIRKVVAEGHASKALKAFQKSHMHMKRNLVLKRRDSSKRLSERLEERKQKPGGSEADGIKK